MNCGPRCEREAGSRVPSAKPGERKARKFIFHCLCCDSVTAAEYRSPDRSRRCHLSSSGLLPTGRRRKRDVRNYSLREPPQGGTSWLEFLRTPESVNIYPCFFPLARPLAINIA